MNKDDLLKLERVNQSEDVVTSVIERAVYNSDRLFLCACSPPSGEWGTVRYLDNNGRVFVRKMPKKGHKTVKRPDILIQDRQNVWNFLSMESKLDMVDLSDDIEPLTKNYISGSDDFEGVLNGLAFNESDPSITAVNPIKDIEDLQVEFGIVCTNANDELIEDVMNLIIINQDGGQPVINLSSDTELCQELERSLLSLY